MRDPLASVTWSLLLIAAVVSLAWPDIRTGGLLFAAGLATLGLLLTLRRTGDQRDLTRTGVLNPAGSSAPQDDHRLTAILDGSFDSLLAVNHDLKVVAVNAAAERLFERSRDELKGKPLVWVLPDESALETIRTTINEGYRGTCQIERPNKQYLRIVAVPVREPGEWSALAVIHDLTDEKRTDQIRRDFVANVSHELRTPLASIKAVIETLQEGALSDEATAQDFLRSADSEVDRLVQMVEELIELSRIEAGDAPLKREPLDISGIIAHAVSRLRPQADKRGVEVSYEIAPGLPAISGDAERLERAVINLVQNAIKFTSDRGSVRVAAQDSAGVINLTVTDSGVGIAPADLPRVFERFFKADRARQSGGSGLGLALVKHTVEAHGGQIEARSELGRGSTFTIVLPATAE